MGARNTEHKKSYTLEITDNYHFTLRQIVYYIAFEQKQPLNALKVGEGINKAMIKIVKNPLLYAECENIPTKTKMYREAGYKSWLNIFKVKSNEVTILGVISGKQKPNRFKKMTK
ncbi:hypothetical protein FFWV33_11565 [Flavobacterium faecale]|uniref:Plasmid stabilization protein n=1 Tax=Flavobacterium faecale TaxID=1355330 RepID=A0A2S1LE95_9FLAO|nr:type II toxin-antitoxin system RelE/ParE family toxin [Flavobacterium faecale]AWG22102.1 hypothetical protein FFWV33_11565 [Flavobacterium faecale]